MDHCHHQLAGFQAFTPSAGLGTDLPSQQWDPQTDPSSAAGRGVWDLVYILAFEAV